ncbi:MAG: DUF6261 family protein [Paludibacter sp.]|jgi:hypothetical protein|nr:DUF6261 family protein [Paludibacter sp.]
MYLSEMTTETLAELTKRVLTISKKEEYAMTHNHALVSKIEATATNYLAVFDKQKYSGLGKQVAEADLLRDTLFMSFRVIITGFSKMPGFAKQQEAIDLKQFINKHGNGLHMLSYGDQSSHLDKLIEALDTEPNQTRLATLNLTDCYVLLKNAQTTFSALYHKQVKANAELRRKLSASSLTKQLASDLRNYSNYVEAMGNIDENWKALSSELNEVMKAAKNSKQQRETEEKTEMVGI